MLSHFSSGSACRQHLTPQRSNGVRAMINRIKADAQRAMGSET